MNHLVSIVIPVFNRGDIIHRSIDSALIQTYSNIEIIIVDNASTDNTWDVLCDYRDKYKQIKIFKNEINIGPVKNWIKGVVLAKGEFVKILFSDDWIDANDINSNVQHLIFDKEIAFVYNPVLINFPNKKLLFYQNYKDTRTINSRRFLIRQLLNINVPVSPCSALFRRVDLVKNILTNVENKNGLDFNNFGAGTDLLIFLLTAYQYPKVMFSNEVNVNFLSHNGSLTVSNSLSYFYEEARIYFIRKVFRGFNLMIFTFLIRMKTPRFFTITNYIFSKRR